jgi:hypothetical protein
MATIKTSLVSLVDDFTHRPQQNFQSLTPGATGSIKLPFRYVKNFRRDPARRNVLMQTPVWNVNALDDLPSLNAETEAAQDDASVVNQFMDFGTGQSSALLCNYLWNIDNAQQYVIYDLMTWPAGAETDSHKQLLLDASANACFATLGDSFDVVIDSPTTFSWSINGGAVTSGVLIAAQVIIAGIYVLSFQPDDLMGFDNYNTGDAWRWERHDSTNGAVKNVYGYNTYVRIANTLFFIGTNGRVYRSEIGTGTYRARSVGYSPVYGSYLAVFYNHLVVGNFSQTGWTNNTLCVGWSDLNNYDLFFPTAANEADLKQLTDSREAITTGLQLFNNNLYVATPSELYRVDYVGLPNVFEFVRISQTAGGYLSLGVLGLYVAGYNNDIVIYDGTNFNRLQAPLYVTRSITGQEISWTGTFAEELNSHLLHFDEVVGEFFTQSVPYTDQVTFLNPLSETSVGYSGGDGKYYTTTNGPGNSVEVQEGPEVRTSLLCVDDPEHLVEMDSVWIDAHLGNGKTASLYYKAVDTVTNDPGTWTLAGVYSDGQFQQRVECRFSARYFAFRIVFDTSVPGSAQFAGMSAYIYGVGAKTEK